jgi:glycosyltransferase involved in cell wall biosynthesis
MAAKLISIIIPVYNEGRSLRELYDSIKETFREDLKTYQTEIIFVDDGSTDETPIVLKQLNKNDPWVKIIRLRKNLGKAAALNQGFRKAGGEMVVTLDGDLQDGPENIPLLISKLSEGYDLVNGWKVKRFDGLDKTLPSKIFNWVIKFSSGISIHDFNCGLKIMRGAVAKELVLYGELHRFIPVLAAQRGFRVTEVPVTHHPRKYGVSKYGWRRLISGFFDFLTIMFLNKFGGRPFHLFGFLGAFMMTAGMVFGAYLSALHFQGISISSRPLLNLSVLLIIAGLQLISIGFIADLIVNRQENDKTTPIDYEI